jgi:hypothetical protein
VRRASSDRSSPARASSSRIARSRTPIVVRRSGLASSADSSRSERRWGARAGRGCSAPARPAGRRRQRHSAPARTRRTRGTHRLILASEPDANAPVLIAFIAATRVLAAVTFSGSWPCFGSAFWPIGEGGVWSRDGPPFWRVSYTTDSAILRAQADEPRARRPKPVAASNVSDRPSGAGCETSVRSRGRAARLGQIALKITRGPSPRVIFSGRWRGFFIAIWPTLPQAVVR